jgi:hypothetical protein
LNKPSAHGQFPHHIISPILIVVVLIIILVLLILLILPIDLLLPSPIIFIGLASAVIVVLPPPLVIFFTLQLSIPSALLILSFPPYFPLVPLALPRLLGSARIGIHRVIISRPSPCCG